MEQNTAVTLEKIAALSKRRGFVYPTSEIYGGLTSSYDYGPLGAELLRRYHEETGLELEKYARICERHTGTGLTAADIRNQNLPLPERDYLPETAEEKLICLADKFFSKSGDMQEKPVLRIVKSLRKYGPETLNRWESLCVMFGLKP